MQSANRLAGCSARRNAGACDTSTERGHSHWLPGVVRGVPTSVWHPNGVMLSAWCIAYHTRRVVVKLCTLPLRRYQVF
eukprot:8922436-Pyramimonas_sp.AAC.1